MDHAAPTLPAYPFYPRQHNPGALSSLFETSPDRSLLPPC